MLLVRKGLIVTRHDIIFSQQNYIFSSKEKNVVFISKYVSIKNKNLSYWNKIHVEVTLFKRSIIILELYSIANSR